MLNAAFNIHKYSGMFVLLFHTACTDKTQDTDDWLCVTVKERCKFINTLFRQIIGGQKASSEYLENSVADSCRSFCMYICSCTAYTFWIL